LLPNFWLTFFIKFSKKSKNSEKQEKIQKNTFFKYIYIVFFIFSIVSKEFKIFKIFETRSTCNALFLKSPIFLIRVDVDKKNPKNKKNQIYKKKKEIEGPSLET
jgi:hypothetical protein